MSDGQIDVVKFRAELQKTTEERDAALRQCDELVTQVDNVKRDFAVLNGQVKIYKEIIESMIYEVTRR